LAGVTLFGIWLGIHIHRSSSQQKAVGLLRDLGVQICYSYEVDESGMLLSESRPLWPQWLRSKLGDDFFCSVRTMIYYKSGDWTEGLDRASVFSDVRRIHCGGAKLEDDGLERLKPLKRLETLGIEYNGITDAGLRHLRTFPHLKHLFLKGNFQITDAGMETLGEMQQLESLDVMEIPVSDRGVKYLAGLTNLRELHLRTKKLTNVGLAHLQALGNLERLSIESARITDACVSDLKRLSDLQFLSLRGTQLSDVGLSSLQRALPNCQIKR
jgi:Leucine-rich repeat (LRR) protein